MNILGISGGIRQGNQDGAAALIRDNMIVASAEEERFTRIKHSPGVLPENAIRFCLKEAGITIEDVDQVTFPGATYLNFEEILEDFFKFRFNHSPRIQLIDHHHAHAASAFHVSGFDEAMILTMDLSGDNKSTTLSYGRDNKIERLRAFLKPNSLGLFYSCITEYLGFQYDTDEYKVMGLSSYGKPEYDLSWFVSQNGDNGAYSFDPSYVMQGIKPGASHPSKQLKLGSDELWQKLGHPRRRGEPITDHHANVAASAQRHLENIAINLVTWLHEKTGSRKLCLAGGVALNCVMNQKLRALPFIDEIYIQPAASDAGLAIGGAVAAAVDAGYRFPKMSHAFLGPSFSDDEIEKALNTFGVRYTKVDDITKTAAQKVSEGKIVGWFQGKMELGPRALGARSIIADPRDASMKDKVNELVKFREEFRPFAPSILAERVKDFFKDGGHDPFMVITCDTKEEKKGVIPAVVHVDGTARTQTVEKPTNCLYYRMISEFCKLTDVPVVLNTSFNIKGQPVVLNPQQAISTFFGTGMNCLAIGSFFLEKS